jgi:hypothetical protein
MSDGITLSMELFTCQEVDYSMDLLSISTMLPYLTINRRHPSDELIQDHPWIQHTLRVLMPQ